MSDAIIGSNALREDVASAHPLPGEVIAGKYRVEGVVGSGGMGVVVAAQHLQLGQKVAIKLLSIAALESSRRGEACARFLREGRAAAQLTSDHVVRIYDVGTLDNGAPFMVMELLRGEDLATLFERRGPAPVEVAADCIVQACDAVGEAHALGIVHRDLKPSNLFVCRRNDGRVAVKVLDFGISKALFPGSEAFEGNLTETRSVVGSPYYMSPEQVRDAKRVDARTDIWALGMILYELLTGEPAFNAETLPGICAAIAADQPPPIRDRRPDVPPALEAIVMRCLDKDPARRFPSTRELVSALLPYMDRGAAKSSEYASPDVAPAAAALHADHREMPTLDSGALAPAAPVGSEVGSASGVSAKSPAVGAVRSVRDADSAIASSATLVSPSNIPPPERQGVRRSSRGLAAAGLAALLLVGGGVVIGVRRPEPSPPVTPAATAAAPRIEPAPTAAPAPSGEREVVSPTPAAPLQAVSAAVAAPEQPPARTPPRVVTKRSAPPRAPAPPASKPATAPSDIRLER